MLGSNPFSITASSQTVTVTEINHGRTSGDTVRFRNVQGSQVEFLFLPMKTLQDLV